MSRVFKTIMRLRKQPRDISWLEEWYQVRHHAGTDARKSLRFSENSPKVLHHREGEDLGSQLQRVKQ